MEITITDWAERKEISGIVEESGFTWFVDPSESASRELILSQNLWIMTSSNDTTKSLRDALGKGIPKLAFDRLRQVTAVPIEELCRAVRIPYRTLSRRSVLKPEESDRVFRVGLVFQTILEVTGDLDVARRWFTSAKRALGGETPLTCCETEIGAREVIDLLGRIEHGVFS